jgi:hypothetical protein
MSYFTDKNTKSVLIYNVMFLLFGWLTFQIFIYVSLYAFHLSPREGWE